MSRWIKERLELKTWAAPDHSSQVSCVCTSEGGLGLLCGWIPHVLVWAWFDLVGSFLRNQQNSYWELPLLLGFASVPGCWVVRMALPAALPQLN